MYSAFHSLIFSVIHSILLLFSISVCCFYYRSYYTGILLWGNQKATQRRQIIYIFSLFIKLDIKINFNEHF